MHTHDDSKSVLVVDAPLFHPDLVSSIPGSYECVTKRRFWVSPRVDSDGRLSYGYTLPGGLLMKKNI